MLLELVQSVAAEFQHRQGKAGAFEFDTWTLHEGLEQLEQSAFLRPVQDLFHSLAWYSRPQYAATAKWR
ncbi:hypothetical protein GCM10025772_04900 [Ferrimonas gelatinilytica]|uniref:Uncharacterized protein n=1 Tax=Ferrimonas gelatinilytica TaxID=1255257 RepID=A0ABP9RW61_9GAMM